MDRLTFIQLSRNKWKHFLFFLALLLIFITVPLALHSLQRAHQQVESDITYYARGTYDLLVRPMETEHPLEEKLGMVPENYIGFGNGGISINTWETIKSREDIEIAAPVASLGYFTGVNSTLAISPPQANYMRYITEFATTDGVNRYPIEPEYMCALLKYETDQFTYESIINNDDLRNDCVEIPAFPLPATYHLVVGIDPTEEEKLTNTSFSSIASDSTLTGSGSLYTADYPNAKLLPIVEVIDKEASLSTSLSIGTLDLSPDDIVQFRDQLGLKDPDEAEDPTLPTHFYQKKQTKQYKQLVKTLRTLDTADSEDYTLDLSSVVNAFDQNEHGIYLTEDGDLDTIENHPELFQQGYFINQSMSASSAYYQASQTPYELSDGRLSVPILDVKDGVPIYREIKKQGNTMKEVFDNDSLSPEDIAFIPDPVDTVEMGEKEAQLAASPLGIYQFEPARYIGKEKNESIELEPTMTPGSFVTPSAKGLTNMEAAVTVKGDEPIDAIRVKVAGIDQYTEEAATKIEKIADELRHMDLNVTIVAGASPQNVEVDVEGIGLVEESWTTLGAAGTIVGEWSISNLVLAILFVLVGGTYIFNRFIFWRITKEKDTLLLSQLGWTNHHIQALWNKEVFYVLSGSAILAIPLLMVLSRLGGLDSTLYVYQLITVLIAGTFVWFFIRKAIPKLTNPFLSKNNPKKSKRNKRRSLVNRNIHYYWRYIVSAFTQLAIVSTLATFVYLAINETVSQTNTTVLGEYINVQVNHWHLILVVSAYILAFITLIEALMSLFKIRKKEIKQFLLIGWRKKDIFQLYMKEIFLWTGCALLMGNLISILLFMIFYSLNWTVFLVATLSFLGLYLFIVLLAMAIVWRYISKPFASAA
ncbi:FtsX-like permease family protein [Sediminibacillus halophilus]|uniref:Putative ABC transport system permease protein n=1 Tax=Sediminibacillus halophilus TaxID=482461 RepID=A0A1G9UXS4_9BACI|nr:FtsX-like permease family protein [Sediminibacillus halophilus]SDM64606.1 putative ABC transport system permease protein [Sediminibacillus halophilus]